MRYYFVVSLLLASVCFPSCLLGQTTWHVDPYNPHLPYYRILDPSVLYDSRRDLYQLWASDGYYAIRGVSLNGRDWFDYENNYNTIALTAAFGIKFLHGVEVVHVDTLYYMYYTAHDWNDSIWIGLATSSDGFWWSIQKAGPLIGVGASGSWESRYVWYPKVVVVGGVFYMLYGGHDGSTGAVGLATSNDGFAWQKYSGNPVLSHGGATEPDARGVGPAGITYEDGTYYLMFSGEDFTGRYTLSLATSTDCFGWSKYQGNPVLGPGEEGSWDAFARAGGALRYAQGAWHYWYSGTWNRESPIYSLGYASSEPLFLSAGGDITGMPAEVKLFQNYPNPFNPSTTIRYALPRNSLVQITVFNALGQQVATLVQGEEEAGYHETAFNASGLSSGVYFCRLTAGSFVQARKLLLVR